MTGWLIAGGIPTTPAFLRCFGLSSLDDLPPLPEIPVPEQTD